MQSSLIPTHKYTGIYCATIEETEALRIIFNKNRVYITRPMRDGSPDITFYPYRKTFANGRTGCLDDRNDEQVVDYSTLFKSEYEL